jgi:hypothetical protein
LYRVDLAQRYARLLRCAHEDVARHIGNIGFGRAACKANTDTDTCAYAKATATAKLGLSGEYSVLSDR